MQPTRHGWCPLQLQQLEARETPASLSESFDTAPFPFKPAGWIEWTSNDQDYYATTRTAATSGQQSLAIYGNINVASRLWNSADVGNDLNLSAQIRSDAPAPILMLARGSRLDSTAASYIGTAISATSVAVRESISGNEQSLKTISFAPIPKTWLLVQTTISGNRVGVSVQRGDTKQFLNSNGSWQASATEVVVAATSVQSGVLAGVGRLPGPYGTAYLDDFLARPIAPAPPPPPSSPPVAGQNYSHIRIAQLAYESTPVGNYEKQLAADSIDLIVPNAKFLDGFEEAAADSAKYLYSNASNLYSNLIADWLSHAVRIRSNPEAAFYHVTQATPFTGNSPSAQPVTWLWGVYRGAVNGGGPVTDLTSNARAGRTVGVTFGGVGEAITLGHLDRFRELNVTMSRSKQASWTGLWEYVAATDANGKPTVWKSLPIVSDGTLGLVRNGQITFDPPRDWVSSVPNGSSTRLFAIRFRTTAGTAAQAPEAKSILGRDYVNARGQTTGTIPAFDYSADRDGDGYLNDQEYGVRRSGFDARFIHETRLFYPFYGQMRFVLNPTSDVVKNWSAGYHAALLAAATKADGVFLDNASGRIPFAGTSVQESTADFTVESARLIDAIRRAAGGRAVVANTAGGRTEANAVTAAAGIAFEEFLLRPNSATWQQVADATELINGRLAAGATSVILDSLPASTANMTDPRTQLGALSYYYLLADPIRTYFMIWGGFAPSAAWSKKWILAAAVNVGQPMGSTTTFAEGADPQNAKLTYKVLARSYENALVLFKPVSYKLGQGTGTTDNATATTHILNGNYRELRADGTLGAVVTRITLRNGEGAVLMKA